MPILLRQAGGVAGLHAALPATHFQVLGSISFARAMEFFLPTMLLMLGNQAMYQKFFSAKSERDARVAVVGWVVGTVILETIIVAIAVIGSALYRTGEVSQRPREIIAYTATHGLPALLGALLLGAVFAKVISTANNYLFSPATNLVNDVFLRYMRPDASNKRILLVSRLVVVGLGIWALVQGAYTVSILEKALYAYTIYSAALTPVILAAFYSRRINSYGAVACIAAGTFVTVFWDTGIVHRHLPAVFLHRDAIFPALIASLICLFRQLAHTPSAARKSRAVFAVSAIVFPRRTINIGGFFMMRRVYMDANATTPLLPEVFRQCSRIFERFGNASSVHSFGQQARGAVEQARISVAALLRCRPAEIVFTSGGTESDNLALFGATKPGDHVITTTIEHHAVLHAAEQLAKSGRDVTFVPVDDNGVVDPDDVRRALRPNTRSDQCHDGEQRDRGDPACRGDRRDRCRSGSAVSHRCRAGRRQTADAYREDRLQSAFYFGS